MGIRPTSIEIADEKDYDAQFTVDVFENLGDERIISIRILEDFLTIVIEDMLVFQKGSRIYVKMKEDLLYLFDRETGERVREQGQRKGE